MDPTVGVSLLTALGSSKLVWGAAAVVVNLGARFLSLTPAQQQVLQHPAFRRVVLFAIVFMATRDVVLSLALGMGLILLLEGLANEHSKFCMLPGGLCTQALMPQLMPGGAAVHRIMAGKILPWLGVAHPPSVRGVAHQPDDGPAPSNADGPGAWWHT